MPCRTDYYEDDTDDKTVCELEELLCSASRALVRLGYDFSENPLLDGWWHEHEREDNERRRREAIDAKEHEIFDALMEKKPSEMTAEEKAFFFGYALKNR
jgi:hypothetical protein